MDKSLLRQAMIKFFSGVLLVGLLLFLPAGTLHFRRAWLLMGILFIPMFLAGLVMRCKSPDLLRRRLKAREAEGEQRTVIALSGLMFLLCFILAGLNFRSDWMMLPRWVSLAAAGVFLLGYGLFAEVLRENAYLARTIEVEEGQKLLRGDCIGLSGKSGRITGPHLHYEIMYRKDYVNPALYMDLDISPKDYYELVRRPEGK